MGLTIDFGMGFVCFDAATKVSTKSLVLHGINIPSYKCYVLAWRSLFVQCLTPFKITNALKD